MLINSIRFLPNKFTAVKLILLTALFVVLSGNVTFFDNVTDVYPLANNNGLFILSLFIFCYSIIVLLALIFSLIFPTRFVLSFFILLAAVTGYYADQLGIVIDANMIKSVAETNLAEASDLMTAGFISRVALLGVLPVFVLWWLPYKTSSVLKTLRYKTQALVITLAIIVLCIAPLSDHYASFFREHKPLRYYSNPAFPIYSAGKFIMKKIKSAKTNEFVLLTKDAVRVQSDAEKELVIMVVGETARADRFSLNGYGKNTNPRLSAMDNIISYTDINSCGTSTAISVPCMFSYSVRDEFDLDESDHTQNLLDIMKIAGVNILWRDNNSDSKGVAKRIKYQNFRSPEINGDCDIECRDTGMLGGLQQYIDTTEGDILIILHQMGSHGPAYYKRYPDAFSRFTPACETAELAKCSLEEISNAYDNTILYTDYFLSRVIELLKDNTPAYETSMLYVSDHGESLGENNLYLHGLPYLFAPKSQTNVPVIVWASESSDIDYEQSSQLKSKVNSHDMVFRTLLEMFEIEIDLPLNKTAPIVVIKKH